MKQVILLLTAVFTLFLFTGCPEALGIIPETYNISYDDNGADSGSVPVDSTGYIDGVDVFILDNTGNLSKSAYTFAGWNTSTDGSGTTYTGGTTYTMGSANIVLYAAWSQDTHNITFNANGADGGNVPVDSTGYIDGAKVTILDNTGSLSKSAYTFAGWNTFADGNGTTYTGGTTYTMGSVNVILYAVWSQNTHVIAFNANEGTGTMLPQTVAEGTAAVLRSNSFNRIDYSFTGWARTSTGNVEFADGSSYEMETADLTLYAVWSRNTHTLTFETNGGVGPTVTQVMNDNEIISLLPNTYIRKGYKFIGWSDTSGETVDYMDESNYSHGTSDVTLYAVWQFSLLTQWAKSTTTGPANSEFFAVDTGSNQIFAAGYQFGTGTYSYGGIASIAGTDNGTNAVLVAYDANGLGKWAKSVSQGTEASKFNSVAVDDAENVYAVGYQGSGTFTYGSYEVTGTGSQNSVIIKYDSTGTVQWAKTITATLDTTWAGYEAVVVSGSNIYAAGNHGGIATFSYGSINIPNACACSNVLVKYTDEGAVIWAKGATAFDSAGGSWFSSIAVDSSGNIYAVGSQNGTGRYDYGNGVEISGSNSGGNVLLVKYNSAGVTQWARTLKSGSMGAYFSSVALDSSGNVYASGFQTGTSIYLYSPDVSVTGSYSGKNAVLVKYSSSGAAIWARSVTEGSDESNFNAVTVDENNIIYAAGEQKDSGEFTYGEGVNVTANTTMGEHFNSVIVAYDDDGTALSAKSISSGSSSTYFNSIVGNGSGKIYAAGSLTGNSAFTYEDGVTVSGTNENFDTALVQYGH
ncbi:MAG: InlB B-repeat-containing protein [Spirochaetales bacterium]|nr:InlB B-repeat-containing protein [Spirochaetales bacterium]